MKYPYSFDPKKRRIAKIYTMTKILNGLINGFLVPAVFLTAFLYSGGSDYIASLMPESWIAVPLYTIVFLLILSLVHLPLRFYSSFVYEHKHGLSTQTLAGWTGDYAKSSVLSYAFSLAAVTGVYYLMSSYELWWLWAGAVYLAMFAVLDYISPVFILPLFYKLEPLKDRKYRKKILDVCRKLGATGISNVLVANESQRSVKANALFTGYGATKRIVLFDTLMNNFTKDEIETVIGHEVGHYLNRDMLKGFLLEAVLIFPVLYIVDMALRAFAPGLGIEPYAIASLPLFMLAYTLINFVLMPFSGYYSRRMETAADAFALDHIRKPFAQISAEKRLADNALQDHEPPAWAEMLIYSHPAPIKRIKLAEDWARKNGKR
ncbi:MAG: M48 family metallopeptidase [Candidatus Aenigmarchaeota archaeon]|nr:M48 family metallopeptidase [Candidatus Aenigmarchaeota archaeon]